MIVWLVDQQKLRFEEAYIGNNLNELEDTSASQINWDAFTSCLGKLHINEEVPFRVMLNSDFARTYDILKDVLDFRYFI